MSIAVNNQNVSGTETQATTVTATVKRGRGRPKGAKNKPKFNADGTPVVKTAKTVRKVPSVVSYDEMNES